MGTPQQNSWAIGNGYTGWRGSGRAAGLGGGGSTFNFDYAAEAEKAYGELGVYYDRILKESKGDLDIALARLNQDYERGMRIAGEDLAVKQALVQRNKELTSRSVTESALSRGLYQKSAYASGYGIPDTARAEALQPLDEQNQLAQTGFERYKEQTGLSKTRSTEDLNRTFERNTIEREQQRRREAADIANQRGSSALAKWSATLYA